MAKVVKSKKTKPVEHFHLALTNKNYMIIGVGVLLIIIGYVFMAENSVDGFLPTVIAPVFLVLGYIVVIPLGILFKDKTAGISDEKAAVEGTSNVKTK